jgi:hypothetical protein
MKLHKQGEPSPQAMVVVAPSFSDIEVLAINRNEIRRYRFTGQTAFDGTFLDTDSATATTLPGVDLKQSDHERIDSAMSRNTRYAMSIQQPGGKDGIMYYFRYGSGHCASVWSPDPQTLAGHLAALVDELRGDQPDFSRIRLAIESLESFERSH